MTYPPDLGSRGSAGTGTLYRSKSAGVTARLSATVNVVVSVEVEVTGSGLMNESKFRRWYPASTETRGKTSCCTEMPNCQLPGRTPHPSSRFGSYVDVGVTSRPKF